MASAGMFQRELRDLAHVHRWGIQRRIRHQNVAEHSYYVTVYAVQIAQFFEMGDDAVREVAILALTHDIGELWTGDMPAPAKLELIDPERLHEFEQEQTQRVFGPMLPEPRMGHHYKPLIKIADLLESCLYLADEINMGNQSVGFRGGLRTTYGDVYSKLLMAIGKASVEYGWIIHQSERFAEFMQHVEEALSTSESGLSAIFVRP